MRMIPLIIYRDYLILLFSVFYSKIFSIPAINRFCFMEKPKPHLLLVDDDDLSRDMLSLCLTRQNYTCDSATCGENALLKLQDNSYDLVLLDVMMPGISGLDALKEIRKNYTQAHLPVIMVTAQDRSESIITALELGANDYLTKPLDIPVVLARIKSQLKAKQLHDAEEQILQKTEFIECLIDSAYEMIIATDIQRHITMFNRAAEASFGYSKEDVLGKHVDMLYADSSEGKSIHGQTVRENGFTGEILNRKKNGDEFYCNLSASILRDKHGEPIGLMGLSYDISKQKELEAEKERLDQLKDEFMSIASHDIKSPLTTIKGFAAILKDTCKSGTVINTDSYNCIDRIHKQSNTMQKIIDDFLDFQALEENKLRLDVALEDLNELARSVADEHAEYAHEKEVHLNSDNLDNELMVEMDADRIGQVIRNFVSNAIKFCFPNNSISILSRLENGNAVIEVKDTGPGLSDEDFNDLFVKYARLSNKPTGGEKSSGLGLAICKQLIEMHHGEIGATNNEDQLGVTFWFKIPLKAKK